MNGWLGSHFYEEKTENVNSYNNTHFCTLRKFVAVVWNVNQGFIFQLSIASGKFYFILNHKNIKKS